MIVLPAHIERIFQQVDGSWNCKISFGELNPEQVTKLAAISGKALVSGFTLAEDFTKQEKTLMQQIAAKFVKLGRKQAEEKETKSYLDG